ncbi:transcriptional regulator [Bradyrhizobium sp. CCBAU 21362]|uniref:helix-turn-helix domain-containing transcriptional regulator n=1 Tax=Bradyrhizobium sp. CCBAU 21362 TaxID=1325082 RepID=UPI002306BF39|nr:transcriptional regulator [Bradyrhizobium sp. CCBAU 21362]MDA9538524.1 transcriptional regulator [Bradyrhizobium sp. CCBAU 21362]
MLAGDTANLADLVRDNPAAAAAYLTEKFEENDISKAQAALSTVMRAQNVQILARDAGLRRDALYRTFGGRIDPQLSRVLKLFDSMDVRALIVSTSSVDGSEAIAAQLCEAFAENNPDDAIRALSAVAKSQNVPALALAVGIQRTSVYKTFGGSVDPQLGRVLNLFRALQLRFTVVPGQPKVRLPRPRLGRPPKTRDRPD